MRLVLNIETRSSHESICHVELSGYNGTHNIKVQVQNANKTPSLTIFQLPERKGIHSQKRQKSSGYDSRDATCPSRWMGRLIGAKEADVYRLA